uniref:Secreted protein n=1 Tax=Panstrongylus lignarius TaxID=156445 RepID=A0A224XST6_9HEMI
MDGVIPFHNPDICSFLKMLFIMCSMLAECVPPEFESGAFCSLVLTKSKGWNKTVENVPESDPARKAFNNGDSKDILPYY